MRYVELPPCLKLPLRARDSDVSTTPSVGAMFAKPIQLYIHPATWAIIGHKKDLAGELMLHRGTGFAVDTHGHILTCWHVTFMDQDCTDPCDRVTVVQPELDLSRQLEAEVVFRDKDTDLAILRLKDQSQKTTPVTMYTKETVPFGTSCAAFGHPLSQSDAATRSIRIFTRTAAGVVSMPFEAPRFDACRPVRAYEADLFAHGGASGGPLFLKSGEVFGVVSGSRLLDMHGNGISTRSNLAIAIDIREAVELLKPLNINPKVKGH